MKTKLPTNRAGVAVSALLAAAALAPSANAIVLRFEQGPNTGQLYTGPVQFDIVGRGSGTTYDDFNGPLYPPAGPTAGNTSAALGVAAMDVLPQSLAPGRIAPSEDQWGIGYVQDIIDPTSGFIVWSPAGKTDQLTAIFYGGKDFYGVQGSATSQTISSVGLTLDIYELGALNPAPVLGGSSPTFGRSGVNGEFFDSGLVGGKFSPNGALLSRFTSTKGFLTNNGAATDTEILTTFVQSANGVGDVKGFFNATPGSIFDTNGFTSTTLAGLFADASVSLSETTTTPFPPGPNQWLVNLGGQIQTNVAVPEPSTFLAGLGCLLPVLGSVFGRRKGTARA